MFLYVCEKPHEGNWFATEFPATEMGEDGIVRHINTLCGCGRVARLVHGNGTLVSLSPGETALFNALCLPRKKTAPLLLEEVK